MAIVEVKVPQLSESVAEATLLQWKKKVGDAVAVDEILIEVETDKVVMEVPAPSAGVLIELVAPDGATVGAEQLIGRIDTTAVAGAAVPVAAVAAPAAAAPVPAAASGNSKAGVAMPVLPRSWPTTAWRPARCLVPAKMAALPRVMYFRLRPLLKQ